MLDLAVWLIAGSCLLFVLSGVLWGWWLASLRRGDPLSRAIPATKAPTAPPPPSPVPPAPSLTAPHPHLRPPVTVEVDLCHDNGRVQRVSVPRKSARLMVDGKAWDHIATAHGRWQYRPVDPANKATQQMQARASQ